MSLPSWCPRYDNRKYDSKTGEEVYCICKKPDSGELMVGCDGCDDWFHFSCLKIPEKYRDLVFSFYCPYCAAGITGPALTNGGKLPKTVWKRKCRLPDCYRECDSTTKSKYCSREHGLQYMREIADKLYLPGLNKIGLLRQLLRETKSLEEFKSMGHGRLPEVDLPLSKEQYDRIVHEDQHLQQLIDERDQLISQKFPKLNDEEIQVNTYIEWVNGINEHLSPQSSNQATSNRKKSKASTKVTICGYHDEYSIPCTANEFTDRIIELRKAENTDVTNIDGVCLKTKCGKHQDWILLKQDELSQQKNSLENIKRRLQLLINIRTNQLGILFFENQNRALANSGQDTIANQNPPDLLSNQPDGVKG
ncbi:COMPASS component SPP1 [Kluyveromyces marxianus]